MHAAFKIVWKSVPSGRTGAPQAKVAMR